VIALTLPLLASSSVRALPEAANLGQQLLWTLKLEPRTIAGATLGLVAWGRLGSAVAQRAEAWEECNAVREHPERLPGRHRRLLFPRTFQTFESVRFRSLAAPVTAQPTLMTQRGWRR